MSSGFTPSASALKFVMMRCRSTGAATAADIFGRDVRPAMQDSVGLGRQDQVHAGTRPAPQFGHFWTKSAASSVGPGTCRGPLGIGEHVIGPREPANDVLQLQMSFAVQHLR